MNGFTEARKRRLRGQYVRGDIEIDEFERRLEAILRRQPLPQDESLEGLIVHTDKPGAIFFYNPVINRDPHSPEDAEPDGQWETY